MLKGEEEVEWTKTQLFEHLCEKFPVSRFLDTYLIMIGFADDHK
jgi:hypothetical protein